MAELGLFFESRVAEIETYLDLLAAVEQQIQQGPPSIGKNSAAISPSQQKMLYSGVYLHLYNLVEATIAKSLEGVCEAIQTDEKWRPADLSVQLRKEWVRYFGQTHVDMTPDSRLDRALRVLNHAIEESPIEAITIEKGGGGNWDDVEIFRFVTTRLGLPLSISDSANKAAKQPWRNGVGALKAIVNYRNELAHGSVSFVECGADVTVADLRVLKDRTVEYLSEVLASFQQYIASYSFLHADSRPVPVN